MGCINSAYYRFLVFLAPDPDPSEEVNDALLMKAMFLSGFTAGRYMVSWPRVSRTLWRISGRHHTPLRLKNRFNTMERRRVIPIHELGARAAEIDLPWHVTFLAREEALALAPVLFPVLMLLTFVFWGPPLTLGLILPFTLPSAFLIYYGLTKEYVDGHVA